jgi:DNA-directed RNA polymerase subunit alpha
MDAGRQKEEEYNFGGKEMVSNAWVKSEDIAKDEAIFEVMPLSKGMGVTLGNALRRVLLSSLSGSAVTAIKVEGSKHEFSTIPDVREDLLDILCNMKGIIFKKSLKSGVTANLKVKGKKVVTAADIVCPSELEIVNPDHYLFETTGNSSINIELQVEGGSGYKSVDQLQDSLLNGIDVIKVDASFSPVLRVNYDVKSLRVGEELNYEQLTLRIKTNGSKTPDETLRESVGILSQLFGMFERINEKPPEDVAKEKSIEVARQEAILNMSIDELELSARSSNCLKRAGIETLSALLEKDMSELVQIKNFGKKSADEINAKLKQYSLSISEKG